MEGTERNIKDNGNQITKVLQEIITQITNDQDLDRTHNQNKMKTPQPLQKVTLFYTRSRLLNSYQEIIEITLNREQHLSVSSPP